MKPVRVVLADDHTLVLEAFKTLLADSVEVVGIAADGHELVSVVRKTRPDVVVTDIGMPGLNGLDACAKLSALVPETKTIFLTVSEEPGKVDRAMRAGASGYLLKRSASSELLAAIEAVAQGKTYITSQLDGRSLNASASNGPAAELEQLTVRQREVLQLLAEGHTMVQAAKILHLAPRTVAYHKYRLMRSLGIDNSAGLIRYAQKSGLVA